MKNALAMINDFQFKPVRKIQPQQRVRTYSFINELMKPDKDLIKSQKESIIHELEIKRQVFLLAQHNQLTKLNRKYNHILSCLQSALKFKRWF
jgi:hypothetical protein